MRVNHRFALFDYSTIHSFRETEMYDYHIVVVSDRIILLVNLYHLLSKLNINSVLRGDVITNYGPIFVNNTYAKLQIDLIIIRGLCTRTMMNTIVHHCL